ncbi:hypothetical protein LSAT2_013331 [Lamellibrachia satsuma]|nr:hypothetical protein LSAT2_013331 [Lamellibrachia satsuma]
MLLRKCKYYVLFIDRVGAIDHVHLRPSDGPRGGDINNSVSVYSRWPVYCNNRPPSSGSTNNSHSVYSRWPDYARCGHLSKIEGRKTSRNSQYQRPAVPRCVACMPRVHEVLLFKPSEGNTN